MSPSLLCLCAAVVGLLVSEWRDSPRARAIFKLSASSAFVFEGVDAGLLTTGPGCWAFAGLVGCFIGDAALLSRARAAFLGGLGAFLVGHLAFAVAFATHGPRWPITLAVLTALLIPARLVHRWLMPHVEAGMRPPVMAYMAVITAMVALAVGLSVQTGAWWLTVGSVAFYLSDLAVARDRFIHESALNHLWGAPAYFIGVWLMAHHFPT